MIKMEQIIKDKGREQFYNYYLSLGYDHKTAASLAMFTYGRYRFKEFSMDDLYNALSKGEEYLPPELSEAGKLNERPVYYGRLLYSPSSCTGSARPYASSPAPAIRTEFESPVEKSTAALSGRRGHINVPAFLSSVMAKAARGSILSEDAYCDEEEECESVLMSPAPRINQDLLKLAGVMGYATDEYEQIEEKNACSTAAEPVSTFRMTTNTASAGVVLNQLRKDCTFRSPRK